MRLMIRACIVTAALLAGTIWPALPGFGTSSEHGPPESPNAHSAGGAHNAQNPPPPKDHVAQCLLDQMNGTRAFHGLRPLPEIPSLLEVAQKHSDKMAAEQSMQHSTEDVFPTLPSGWRAYGENVVYGKTCEQMFEAILLSESHRDALLRPDFNVSGIAVTTGGDGWIYATMVFLNLPVLPPVLPPVQAPAVPSPVLPSPSPVPEAAPAQPVPAVSPSAEPVPVISLLPFLRDAPPGEAGPSTLETKVKKPRRTRQASAGKTEDKKAGAPVSPAAIVLDESTVWVLDESTVWVLDEEAPGALPPESEPDPSQMVFELEGPPGS